MMAGACEIWQQRGSDKKTQTQPQCISSSTKSANNFLQDLYDPKLQCPKAPIQIRPPGPRAPSIKELNLKWSFPSDPPTKTIMRRRAQSLSSSPERKRGLRSLQVRFVDSLGLELEEGKVFKVQEQPLKPQHVIFRLQMSSELAFGKSLELPYFKPCFPENMGAQPDFLKHLCKQSVCLEQVLCSEQGITGTVQVLNLAYEKEVTVHYSHRDNSILGIKREPCRV